MDIIILDGAKMTDKAAAHAHIAEAMGFPGYYGGNLDALADCLSERGGQTCVVLRDSGAALTALGAYGEKLIGVFRELSARPDAFSFVLCRD